MATLGDTPLSPARKATSNISLTPEINAVKADVDPVMSLAGGETEIAGQVGEFAF